MLTRFAHRNLSQTWLLFLIATAGLFIYLSQVMASLGSNFTQYMACPHGPLCGGLPAFSLSPQGLGQLIRAWIAVSTWPIVLMASAFAWWRLRRQYWISIPLLGALVLTGVQVGLSLNLEAAQRIGIFEPLNIGLILILQGLVTTAGVGALHTVQDRRHADQRAFGTPFAKLTRSTLMTLFIAFVSGTVIPVTGASGVCATWPLCGGLSGPIEIGYWVQIGHRLIVAVVAIQVARLFMQAWRTQRENVPNLVLATTTASLYLAQGMIGGLQILRGEVLYLRSLHSATSAAMWVILVFLVINAGLGSSSQATKPSAANYPGTSRFSRVRDFLTLTKPIVVLLLLLTTYGGMVVGGRAWPAWGVTLATLIGGALAAGGSSAINQYIDRERDKLMVRTAKRPIAAGRLTPAEGLAFGVALCLTAFYLLAGFVNLLAACLAVAGIFYYVVLYSLLLKNATVQNIVIGGGAGAIPPLVGWAAVTGNLTLAGVMLFVVIFFWTPPHFWALALVRRKDYERAGVPMLPVVRGEAETRRQIFLYTLVLVAITLLLPFFGLGQGGVYLVGAVILGGWLISSAARVWRGTGNKIAWKMYRHSSMYLAFLFLALMIDAVI